MNETRDDGQQPARERSSLSGPNVDTSEKDKRHAVKRICQDETPLALNDSASESETSDTGQVELVVAIVRAEGFTDGTPTGRKKGKPQCRYFRVSVLDVADGNHPLTSADTSPFCAKGPEFSWGSGGGTGEEVRLLMEPTSFKCGVLLEIKVVRRESAGDDLLLGCGQKALKGISSTANGDSHSHRLHLTLDGNPKGTIEIITSMRMKTSSVYSDGLEELDSGSGNDFIRSPLNRKRLQTQASAKGEQLQAYAKGEEGQGTKAVALSQTRSSKWGIPYILNLTSAFNTRMKHAKRLTSSGLETAAGEETNQRARDDAMRDRNEDESDVGQDNDGQPTSDDKVEEDAPRAHTLPGEGDHASRRDFLSARHDMKLTESLRDNLTGGDKALRTELEQTKKWSQDEGDGGARGLEGILRHDSSKYRRGKRTDCSPSGDRTRQSKDRPNISHYPEGDMSGEESAIKPREQEAGTDDARSHASDSSDSVSVDNDAATIPLAKRNEAIRRRKSFPPKDGGSLLRSFLQPTTPDIDASEESEGDKPSSTSDGIPLDADDNDVTSEIKRENVSTTNNVSPSDVAESMKTKTTRWKAKASSTLFAVKGFRWSKRKNNGGRNRNKGEADSHISRDALTDSVDQLNPSTTPAYATSVGQASAGVSGDVPTTASPTTSTLLITVLCASNLPDKSARTIFGRKKQNIAQDPYVRFKVCDVAVATSAVKGGGSECIWGKGKDGEIVEISVPSALLPKDERIGFVRMYVELWSKASEEREKDVILGSAELPLIDWIGRRPAWAELDVEGNRTSRVKLSVRVKDAERGDLEHIPEASLRSQDETSERIGVSSEEDMVVDASSPALNDGETSAMNAAVDNLNPPLDVNESRETTERYRTLPTIDEDLPHELGPVPMTNSYSGIIPEETNVMEQKSDHSPTDCGLSEVVSRLHSKGSDAPISLKQGIEDLVESGAASACDSAMGSLRDFPQRGGEPDTPDNDINVQQLRADPSGTPAVVNFTVRVCKADSLVMPVSKTPFERVENIAPYVVLNACGSKQSTSAVIGGGPKCRWSGEHEGTVGLSVSYEDLLAAGWGQSLRKDPKLGVEVWNQMSTCRTADTFIGSAGVSLEDVLNNGATWISILREKMCTGRVKIDVESPDLRRSRFASRNGGTSKVNEEEEGGERKTGQGTHEASLDPRGGIVEEDGPGVFVKDSVEGSSGIENTIVSTEEGARNVESIPMDTQAIHHHSESTLVNSCTPSPAVKQRSPLSSKAGASGQPPLIHPQDGRTQAKVLARTLDDATICHKEVPLGVKTDGAFEGLRRRQQGGTAKVLDLAATGSGTSDIATASTGAKTPRLLSTSTREQETTLSGKDEISGDERLRKRDRKQSWNGSSSRVTGRNGTVDRGKTINPSCFAQDRAPESHRKLGPGLPDPATGVGSYSVVTFSSLTKEEKVKRLARAREISRRRKGSHRVNKRWNGEYLGHGSIQPSSDILIAERVHKVVTIQSVFRGWLARRNLRRHQRAAANIQAAFRGYRERRHIIGLRARAERAREEEQRARDRRSRIASKQQELYLLRSTPAQQLVQVDVIRASAMASRIQRFWRRLYRGTSRQHLIHSSRQEKGDALGDGCIGHEGKTRITAPEIKWLRSDRAPAVGLTLEALRQRVALRQRAKERFSEATGRYKTCWHGVFDAPLDNDAGRKLGTIENTYESLIKCREKASRLVAALHCSETERASSAKRRSERLANFRRLQDQLLHPPKLAGADNGLTNTDDSLTPVADVSRQPRGRNVGGVYGKWQVSLDSSEQRRGETAHARAMAIARRGHNKWWAVSLPADVGYNELVDVRKKNPLWATTLGHEDRGRRCPGGAACHRGSREAPKDVVTNGCEYDSDEASLWWYTYASTEAGRADGQRREDIVFTELLERVKTNTSTGTRKRKEQQKKEERERRLRISRKSQRIVDEVLREQGEAHYSGGSCLRGSVMAVQRGAVIAIQRRVRGVLQRKKTALLRAEMRVFGALQALISELRQPELEDASSENHLLNIAGILAEHSGGERADARRTGACSATTRRAVPVPCSAVSWSVPQPSSASVVQDEVMTAL